MADQPLHEVLDHIRRLAGVPPAAERTDRQLLEQFVTRNEQAAFAALVGRHGALVHGVCRRILPSSHDVDDVFQATFLVLARKAAALRWQDAVGPWLHAVAYRLAKKAQAATARRRVVERRALQRQPDDPAAEMGTPSSTRSCSGCPPVTAPR